MNDILVAVDGSKHSEKVVDEAVELAKSLSAKLLLVYVIPQTSIPEEYAEYAKSEHIEKAEYYDDVAAKVLENMGKRVANQDVKFTELHGVGNPTKYILDIAKAKNVRMIVVGVHGLHRFGRVRALGSVARRLIENADVPVVAIP